MDKNKDNCSCPHHKVVPIVVILFGLLFLLEAFGKVSSIFVGMVWPVLVIVGGLTKLGGCKCC